MSFPSNLYCTYKCFSNPVDLNLQTISLFFIATLEAKERETTFSFLVYSARCENIFNGI